jgi:hypothetical protein
VTFQFPLLLSTNHSFGNLGFGWRHLSAACKEKQQSYKTALRFPRTPCHHIYRVVFGLVSRVQLSSSSGRGFSTKDRHV